MLTYTIYKDGYPMGQCQGKREAIKRIIDHLRVFATHTSVKWGKLYGVITVWVRTGTYEEIYTIEGGIK